MNRTNNLFLPLLHFAKKSKSFHIIPPYFPTYKVLCGPTTICWKGLTAFMLNYLHKIKIPAHCYLPCSQVLFNSARSLAPSSRLTYVIQVIKTDKLWLAGVQLVVCRVSQPSHSKKSTLQWPPDLTQWPSWKISAPLLWYKILSLLYSLYRANRVQSFSLPRCKRCFRGCFTRQE